MPGCGGGLTKHAPAVIVRVPDVQCRFGRVGKGETEQAALKVWGTGQQWAACRAQAVGLVNLRQDVFQSAGKEAVDGVLLLGPPCFW